jgi:hypothetical protein
MQLFLKVTYSLEQFFQEYLRVVQEKRDIRERE